MKSTVASILLVVSMVAGQPARHQLSERQQVAPDAFKPPAAQNAPYAPRGWRPQGAAFSLPNEPQVQYGPPATAYGTPSEEPATTEDHIINTTDAPQPSKISAESNSKKKSEAVKETQNEDKKAAYFVVLPQNAQFVNFPQTQSQNLVYAYAVEKSAPVVSAVPQATLVAAPLTAQLQTLPVSTYKAVYSPLTASYVQVDW
ncbi:hypothetical protein FQR65_LT00603 [Abscondita terminalis]|nr:hypothetical protein FQR65_LT00603 [Abscondita terminalis]